MKTSRTSARPKVRTVITRAGMSAAATPTLEMRAGDVFTAPIGHARQYVSGTDEAAIAYVVRGGDSPGPYTEVVK